MIRTSSDFREFVFLFLSLSLSLSLFFFFFFFPTAPSGYPLKVGATDARSDLARDLRVIGNNNARHDDNGGSLVRAARQSRCLYARRLAR